MSYPMVRPFSHCRNFVLYSCFSTTAKATVVLLSPDQLRQWNANTDTLEFTGSGGKPFGIPSGTRWVPAHCDAVLRRHYWFWAESYNTSSNLNTAEELLGMHLTSVGRGCNMVLDMSPTPSGLLQENDVATYAAFGAGQHELYNASLLSQIDDSRSDKFRNVSVVHLEVPRPVARGAIELRENLTHGQAISNYSVEHLTGLGWTALPLHNEGCQTIGNRRIQYFTNVTVETKIRYQYLVLSHTISYYLILSHTISYYGFLIG
eukprot:SAG31_NODE_2604_length_5397_cov_18.535296_3_plen_262_part_00